MCILIFYQHSEQTNSNQLLVRDYTIRADFGRDGSSATQASLMWLAVGAGHWLGSQLELLGIRSLDSPPRGLLHVAVWSISKLDSKNECYWQGWKQKQSSLSLPFGFES